MQLAILGAGITGLTTALVCQRGGHAVRIYAAKSLAGRIDRDYDPTFASLHPAAFIEPQLCEHDPTWFAIAWEMFSSLTTDPAAGVSWTRHWELFEDPEACRQSLASPILPDVTELTSDTVGFQNPDGGPLTGWESPGLLADLPTYATWLMDELTARGGTIEIANFSTLAEALAAIPEAVVLNCTGLGAGRLVGDTALEAVGGQLLRVKYDAAMPRATVAGRSYHYYPRPERYGFALYGYPRAERLILGGSRVACDPSGGGDLARMPAVEHYEPMFALNAHVLRGLYGVELAETAYAYTIGLRPYRAGGPRLEAEEVGDRRVIHNYGHGGAGVSLSWGCAAQVLELLEGD